MNGVITMIKPQKGFGFIRTDRGVDYFFHRSAVEGRFDTLREGVCVEFEVDGQQTARGPRAARVALVASRAGRDEDMPLSASQG